MYACLDLCNHVFVCTGTLEAAVPDMMKNNSDKTTGLVAFFNTTDGKTVLEACKVLNYSGKKQLPTAADVEASLKTLFEFFSQKPMAVEMKQLALFSAKQYVNAMNILESYSLLGDRQHWARELSQQIDRHPKALKEFMGKPSKDEALVRGFVGCVMQNIREERRNANGEAGEGRLDEEDAPMSEQEGEDAEEDKGEEASDLEEEQPARSTRSGFSLGKRFSLNAVATPQRQSGDRDRSRSPKAAKEKATKSEKASVLDFLEEASETEEDKYRAHWDKEGAQSVRVFCQELLKKPQEKNVGQLKEMVGKVPDQILESVGLADLPQKLASFTRMPRKENFKGIVEPLIKVADAAIKCFEETSGAAAAPTPTLEDLFDDSQPPA